MASTAEVDLLVNATRTLPRLERDLDRTLQAAQSNMDDLDVNAVLDSQRSLNDMERDLTRIIRQAGDDADPVVIDAAIQQRETLRNLQEDLDDVIHAINDGERRDAIQLLAGLDVPHSLADLHDDITRVARAAQAAAPDIDIDVDIDEQRVSRLLLGLNRITLAAGAAAPVLLRTTGAVVGLSTAAGAAAPLIAGVATAIQNIIPAAAVATTGLLAVQLATNTVKLGMMGVEDAIKAAFEPDADMKEVEKQLKALAPAAADTAREIIGLRKEFKTLQQGIQQRLFSGLAAEVRGLSTSVLPDLQGALNRTATSLNGMAKGVSTAAQDLSEGGVLGQALSSANKGLENLVRLPGQVATAFGELAAAAGPSFERLTKAFAKVADRVSEQLTKSFTSGGLGDAIDTAIDLVAQLGRAFGNVFAGIGNIIASVSSGGEGMFSTFERVSEAFRELTANKGFQEGLRALADVATTVSKTVLPLLAQALKIVARVLVTLAEPVQTLVRTLGGILGRLLTALEPVLIALADAFGKLLPALTPILDLFSDLVVALLPALVPLFESLGRIFVALTPVMKQLGEDLALALVPVLESLGPVLETILPKFAELAEQLFPILTDALIELAPSFEKIGVSLANLLVSLAPVIASLLELSTTLIVPVAGKALPLAVTLIESLVEALSLLVDFISEYVVPAIQLIVDIVRGDFQAGLLDAQDMLEKLKGAALTIFSSLTGQTREELSKFATTVATKARESADAFLLALRTGIIDALIFLTSLPGRVRDSIGDLGDLLYGAGQDIVQGLINGLTSKLQELRNIASAIGKTVANAAKSALGIHSPSTVFAEIGRNVVAGAELGIKSSMPDFSMATQRLFSPNTDAIAFNPPTLDASISPVVYVSIGNEAVDQFVTTRSEAVYNRNARTAAQGVRI